MSKILTITLNPCFDCHYDIPDFEAQKENLVTSVRVETGGKGVNTSRALCVNGVDNLAYIVLGTENGEAFARQMTKDGMNCRYFRVDGRIRENITIHPAKGKETRISFNTFRVPASVLIDMEREILTEDLPGLLISFSGRIPQGLEKQEVIAFLQHLIAKGARVVVDSSSFTVEDLREIHPFLIKPNEQEILSFTEKKPDDIRSAAVTIFFQ